eukprot:GEMP01074569.1.p1 GENE.GEMP01074569.1~~GEMP01074569.1.p1  ORF type:complete len:122 (+),score=32.29 GEMP01074569.1:78-443(+)
MVVVDDLDDEWCIHVRPCATNKSDWELHIFSRADCRHCTPPDAAAVRKLFSFADASYTAAAPKSARAHLATVSAQLAARKSQHTGIRARPTSAQDRVTRTGSALRVRSRRVLENPRRDKAI